MDELSITVVIADRPYKLTINRSEEEGVRKAAAAIDNQIEKYASYFQYKDKQDLLAMVALQFSVSSIEYENQLKFRDQELMQRLSGIDKVLTDALAD
jgi:cell division protein ZapA